MIMNVSKFSIIFDKIRGGGPVMEFSIFFLNEDFF